MSGINVLIFLAVIGAGFVWTYSYPSGESKIRLQQRLPVILLNIALISLLSFVAMWFYRRYFSLASITTAIFLVQFIVVMFFDDVGFYFWHRFLHENKLMLRKIHVIHHRASQPYPIDFIYAHPIEWLGGMSGLTVAFILLIVVQGYVSAYMVWSYTFYRTARELVIHSMKKPLFFNKLPFLCNAKHHGLHHLRARGNYASTFTYLDRLFGTALKE